MVVRDVESPNPVCAAPVWGRLLDAAVLHGGGGSEQRDQGQHQVEGRRSRGRRRAEIGGARAA